MNIDDVLRSHGILGGRSKDDIPPPPITNFNIDSVDDGFLDLSWSNPDDTDFVGVRIQRKTGGYPSSENDGETAYDGTGTSFTDSGLTNETEYYYRAFPYDFDNNFQTDTGQQVSGVPSAYDDKTGSPGPKNLVAGDMQAGYFGEASSSELISGDALASDIGLSRGISQHSTAGWLKFAYKGNIQFVAKKTFRHSISWDNIDAVNAVFGTNVNIGGQTYSCRLIREAENDPFNFNDDDRDAIGSEWNDLMLPIHENAATGNWAYPDYVGNPSDWGVGFTDNDLLTSRDYGDGSEAWGQEARADKTSHRVYRGGYGGVSYLYSGTSKYGFSEYGWRPCLELIG